MYGSLPELLEAEPGVQHTRWVRAHGGLVRYMAFFGEERILLADPAALNHVLLANAYDYPKPNEVRGNLSRLLGKGVLFAEGASLPSRHPELCLHNADGAAAWFPQGMTISASAGF